MVQIARLDSRFLPALLCALGFAIAAGCQEHQLSGKDLQDLKRGTLQQNQAQLTDQDKARIASIQANTREDYDRAVKQILSERNPTAGQ